MKNIYKLIVIPTLLLICMNSMFGQGSPGSFLFTATIHDSLSTPVRMAIDNADNIYVTDAYQKKIRKYNAAGSYSGSVTTVGSPISIAINGANQLFIGDGESGKIFKLNSNGTATELYSGTVFPSSMVFCSDGLLYVTDSKLARVIVLDLSGNVVRTIGAGTLIYPTGITFDKKNNRILVAEHGGIGDGFSPIVKVRIYSLTGTLITSFGANGNGDGKFYRIQGLAVGRCGEIYVPEPYQGNVSVFNENTVFATRFGQYGDSISQLRVPLDIAINSQDKIFITAENNGTIEVFDIAYILPTANITCGDKTICAGTTTDIPVHFTGTAPWTFTYTVNGTNPVTVSSTSNNPYILTVSAPGNYQVTAISDASHTGTCFSGSSTITVNSVIPTAAITSGNIGFCPGQTAGIPIVFTGQAPWTFTYTINNANQQTVGNVTASPYVLNVSDAGNYQITALTGGGCTGSGFTGMAVVTANASPAAVITSGNTTICSGDHANLAISFSGTPPWSFTYTRNSTNPITINNIVDNPFLLPVTTAGLYKIIQVQDAFCISPVSSAGTEITVKALPTSDISSGNSAICAGSTANIIVDFTGTSPWNFTYTLNGTNPVTVNGFADHHYLLAVSQTGTYQVTALSDAGCTATSLTGAAIITENPLPAVDLGPPGEICEGDSIVIDAGAAFLHYFWSDSTTGRMLTAHSAGIYTVTVTDYNGCNNSASKTIASIEKPTATFTGEITALCTGETTDLTIVLTGIPPWTVTYTVNGVNQQTVGNILYSPYLLNVYKPGVYHISETLDARCRNTVSPGNATIIVNPLPTYNFSSGNASVCKGQPTNLVIDFTGTPPWSCTYTVNGTNPVSMNGIISNPLIMPVSQAGTYEIIALSDAYCHGNGHNGTATITENPLPPVYLGPDVTIDAGETLTLDAGASFAGYVWSDGSLGQTLQVSVAGSYGVTVTDYNGCSNTAAIQVAVVVPANKDLQDIMVTGARCFSATQTITVAGGASTFVVNNGGSATLIAGQNIRYLPGARVDSGGYMHGYITPDNTYCGGVTPPVVAAPNPVTAVQPIASNEVGSDSLAGEQTNFVAATSGGHSLDNMLKLYPNPSTGFVTIEINNPGQQELTIEISDMAGRHIYSKAVNTVRFIEKADLGSFPGGFYMVKLSSGNITKITKLVLID